MKAFLLAAGYGTRLKPLTSEIPKCLIPIQGKPLLDIWLTLLENEGINEVLINTHYLADKVECFVNKRQNRLKILLSHEETLLGSAGTIVGNKSFVNGEDNFFLIYADNLSNVSLIKLLEFHLSKKGILTTYVYITNVPRQKGIFIADESSGKVYEFQEKPKNPKSNLANAGIGVLNKKIFDFLPNKGFSDFGKDIMPHIINQTYILKSDFYVKDIGTIEDYKEAQNDWKNLIQNGNNSDTFKN